MEIKYCCVIRNKDDKLLTFHKNAIETATTAIKLKYSQHCENSRYGQWYCIYEERGISFLVLTNSDSSQKLAFAFVKDLRDQFYQVFPNTMLDSFATYNYEAEIKFIEALCAKYKKEDLEVMINAQKKIETTMTVMKSNLQNMVVSTEELKIAEGKSNHMKETGNQFLIHTQEASKKFKRRFYKIMIVAGIALLVVLWILFGGSSEPNNNNNS